MGTDVELYIGGTVVSEMDCCCRVGKKERGGGLGLREGGWGVFCGFTGSSLYVTSLFFLPQKE